MERILRFKPHLRLVRDGADRLLLIGERERLLIQGALPVRVAGLVDGRRTEREIVEALAAESSPVEVVYTLRRLETQGYLVDAGAGIPAAVAGYWYSTGVDAARAAAALAAAPVAVLATGGEETGSAVDALAAAGVAVDGEASVWLVVARDFLDRELGALNRRARAEGVRWLVVKPSGSVAWIGPIFGAGEGPCWECLAARLRANRPVETFLARRGAGEPVTPPLVGLAAGGRAAVSLAAVSLARWIAEGQPARARLVALDLAALRTEEHTVVRRPQCSVCGDPEFFAARAERPVVLAARPKSFSDDGGYRSVTPEETFERHAHLVSPIAGVVAMIGPLPERDHPLRPVYRAAYFVCPPADGALVGDEFARPSLGKGRTAAQARAGALCEAVERYSAVFQGDEPVRIAPFGELGDEAVRPPALLHFSAAQYRRREELNRGGLDTRRLVPLPFDERVPIAWSPAWSLTGQRRRLLPSAFCFLHAPSTPEGRFSFLDPNGHAAGNCLEEAILQGFLELAERDAVGIWWYSRARRPAVDLASFDQPYFAALEAHYRGLGYRIWVLDVTNDLELPAFVALARGEETGRMCAGFGCHLEARLGVQRALTELNQLFDPADRSAAPWGEAPLDDPSFLEPADAPLRRRSDFADVGTTDIADDVRTCVARAARLGLETIVMDQTRPDIGIHAVKVVVPGLRHFWPRLGPGRLYDVPVRLGWLARPRAEEELNPVPLYL